METDREFSAVASLPQFPGQSVVTRRNASANPDEATAETVAVMQQASLSDSISPQVWAATKSAIAGARDRREICEGVFNWCARNIRFRSDDPVLKALLGLDNELDLLIRPARLLTMSGPAEDCDGFTMLACSMLLCAGVPCEIVTIKADPDEPTRFSHVYNQVPLENGQMLVMDCSQGAYRGHPSGFQPKPCGWEAPDYYDRKAWGVMQPQQRKGLQGLGACYDPLSGESVDCGPVAPRAGVGIDLNSLLQQIVGGTIQVVKQVTLPAGSYVANAGGVMSNQVPGAVPGYNVGASAFGSGIGGISTTTLMIGGGLLAVLLIASKKH